MKPLLSLPVFALAACLATQSTAFAASQVELKYGYTFDPAGPDFKNGPLNLYPGYVEPVDKDLGAVGPENPPEALTMFVATSQVTLNKPAKDVGLDRFTRAEDLASMDPNITHALIPPPNDEALLQPSAPHAKWCQGADLCLRSTFVIPDYVLYIWQQVQSSKTRKISSASEVRYFRSAALLGTDQVARLKSLTGNPSAIDSILEQNFFRFSKHYIRFAKLVAVVQPDQREPAKKSVLTSFFVFAFEKTMVDARFGTLKVRDALSGKSTANNLGGGIASGLPNYTKTLSAEIATALQ